VLGPQSARAFRHPRPVTGGLRRAALAAMVLATAGCASRADLMVEDQRLSRMLADQRRDIVALQKEVERLRGDLEQGGGRHGGAAGDVEERLSELERRLGTTGGAPSPADGADGREAAPPPPPTPQPAPQVARETPPPAPAPPTADDWDRDVARALASASASNAPDKGEFTQILDGVAHKDCAKAVPQLNSFAASRKDSPLADDALYWAARCYALRGDNNQAISKFYDVVTKYPKGDKVAASLWEQGNLFIDIGDTGDARLALGKLIKDYPNSEEAARARRRLTELEK
jgi:TolA-binding protein